MYDLQKLISRFPADIDGILITSESNLRFLTAFGCDNAYLLVTRNGSIFLTDGRYIEAARQTVEGCRSAELKDADAQICEYAKKFNCASIAIETEKVTVARNRAFSKAFKAENIRLINDDKLNLYLSVLRSMKTEEELANIRRAQAVAEAAFDHVIKHIKPGVTERDIALAIDFYMLRNGAEKTAFDTVAVSGANTSLPHGVPTNKRVESGDFVTMDFGAVCGGYCSDMTRTVAVGEISDKQKNVYDIVLSAQRAAIAAVHDMATCKEVDAAARNIISAAGYGAAFSHSTGHGVGLDIHEFPQVSQKSNQILRSSQLVTIEPGVYLADEFGVRIEDMVVVTADGCDNLTDTPKELIIL